MWCRGCVLNDSKGPVRRGGARTGETTQNALGTLAVANLPDTPTTNTPKALGTLAISNLPDTPTTNTSKPLGTLAISNLPDTPTTNTSKPLGTLAVAARHILAPLG
jgi:hypothetical protein